MAGGGSAPPFDPCECIFSHEGAMRRLISLLRGSQSYCTDEQCFGDAPNVQPTNDGNGMFMMYIMMAWVVAAVVLYFLRPSSMRQGQEKPPSRDNQDQGPPPAPTT